LTKQREKKKGNFGLCATFELEELKFTGISMQNNVFLMCHTHTLNANYARNNNHFYAFFNDKYHAGGTIQIEK
jgi:hypothetical protein